MYRDWFLSSSPEFRQIVWIFSIERPEPMEQYVNMNLTWRSGQRGEERRDDQVGRLSLLTGDCPDCHLNQLWFGINLCSPPIGQQARTALAEASHWLRPAVICNQFLSRISMDLAWHCLSNDGAMLDFFFSSLNEVRSWKTERRMDFIFLRGFRIRVGIFGLGFGKFAILEATTAARHSSWRPN